MFDILHIKNVVYLWEKHSAQIYWGKGIGVASSAYIFRQECE